MLWTALLARGSCAFHVLLREGANLNIKENGNTPLLYLCKQDDPDIDTIRMVIEKKENCNDEGERGETPLLCLFERDEFDLTLIRDFITTGKANCTIRDDRGISPLSYLCSRKRVDIEALMFMFTEGGADINLSGTNGDTPLHWLSKNISVSVDDIKRLTKVGHGYINKPNENGSTPLHFLCERNVDIESLVSLIKEHNGDMNKKDQFGNTPLHYLCFSNKQKVKYLLEKIPEADISMKNEFGYAAEDYLHGKVPWAGTGQTMIKFTVERNEWNTAIGSQIAQLGAGGMASNTTFLGATTAGVPRIDPMEILARTKNEIELKTAGMIRVSAMEDVLKKFNNGQQWVTITGNAGEGKTTLGYLLLKEFLQNYNEVYTLYRPEEYDKIENMEEKRVILLDDRFGAFQADPQKIDNWFDVIDRILSKTYEKKTKIIFIIRTNVVKKSRNYLGHLTDNIFDWMCVVDLSNRELTQELKEERLKILNYHLKHEKVTIQETLKKRVCKMEVSQGFAHCCKMFAKLTPKKYDIHIVDFFKSPLKFLDMTTKILYDGNCQNLFKLLIKNDGQLGIHTIEDDDKREALLRVEKEQEGSYISVSRNVCEFAHPSVYESVLNVINEVDPLFCVRYATLSIIRQRMMIPTTDEENNSSSPLYILVKPNPIVLQALALRFREEILKGDYSVFKHRLCHSGDFCKALIFCCVRLDEKVPNESKQFINAPGKDGNTMFLTALKVGNITAVWVLMKAGIHTLDVNVRDEYGRSPLHFLLEQHTIHKEATHFMIRDMKGNPNLPDKSGSTPLHYFCRRRNISQELLKLMITEGKGDLNQCEQNKSTPLHFLCSYSSLQLDSVDLVIKEGKGDFNKGDEHGTTPFHYVCGHERVEIDVVLRIIKTTKGDINKQDNKGITPLHMLCKGSLQMTNILTLINQGDKADKYGNTPLHFLCRRRGITADEEHNLKQLPQTDMEKRNVFGYTQLDYLADKDEHLPWTDGILARSAADLVVCRLKHGENWIVVLGPTMTLSSEKVHEWLQVEDFGRDLTNTVQSGRRNSPGQFSVFQGSCSTPFQLPSSLLSPSPYPVTTPSYWETSSILRWEEIDWTLLLEMGVVEGQKLDIGSCVSDFANSFSVSLEYGCSFHDQPNSLCIQVRRREQEGKLHQLCECVSLSLPAPGEEFTLTFGLVLDVGMGRVGFIDVERGQLLCKVKQRFTEDVFPMFHVHRFEGHCASRMRLVSGRQISLNDRKIHLIQQALSD